MREPALRLPSTSRLIAVGLRHPLLKLANFEARCHNIHYRAERLEVAQLQEPLDRGFLMIEPLAQRPSMRRRGLEEVFDAAFRVVS